MGPEGRSNGPEGARSAPEPVAAARAAAFDAIRRAFVGRGLGTGARIRIVRSVGSEGCIFCRIVAGEVPAQRMREDEHTLAFRDLRPQAPTHVLVIPKRHVDSLWELDDPALAGAVLLAAAQVARDEGLSDGWRLIANTRDHGGQEVAHLHLHVLGGRPLGRMLPSR